MLSTISNKHHDTRQHPATARIEPSQQEAQHQTTHLLIAKQRQRGLRVPHLAHLLGHLPDSLSTPIVPIQDGCTSCLSHSRRSQRRPHLDALPSGHTPRSRPHTSTGRRHIHSSRVSTPSADADEGPSRRALGRNQSVGAGNMLTQQVQSRRNFHHLAHRRCCCVPGASASLAPA